MATKNFVPRADNEGQIGTTAKKWNRLLSWDRIFSIVATNQVTTALTATNIPGLSFAIGANETWCFEVWMKVGSSSAAGCKYAINFPAAATLMAQVSGTLASATAYDVDTIAAAATLGRVFNTAALEAVAQGAFMEMKGVIVNGANAGTVQIQQAKVTSGNATVYANSYIVARRVA